mmetsp:Transcript_3379/g.3824  ORF Transcript_3379/g.3824 Transcript_3379/m.3824 type:complete len:80 (-) Transcript_3379:1090-1329(-)
MTGFKVPITFEPIDSTPAQESPSNTSNGNTKPPKVRKSQGAQQMVQQDKQFPHRHGHTNTAIAIRIMITGARKGNAVTC